MTAAEWISLIMAAVAIAGTINAYRQRKHSQPLDDYKSAVETAAAAAQAVDALSKRVATLEDELKKSKAEENRLLLGIAKLINQLLTQAHLEPCWRPEAQDAPKG